ncbi:uncharacterized protein LOC115928466 [Strongylocentrotus purpuratus]|uniref:C-type lectin domain-containing protein n=1 Tax=Strongylocentrotus purpuratus TaxID=7668 RepID=A0A7M7PKC6_STRPU|nr:uncharacterized protein LOC115928466 [Strongylocentrotus purpuratus]
MRSSGSSSMNGLWNRITCTSNRQHICQIPIDDDRRWQEFGESQYLIKFTPQATPSAARETCQSYGGDLAIIKTAEVNTFLKALLPTLDSTCSDEYFCFLFGLRRSGRGTFYWLDDTAIQYVLHVFVLSRSVKRRKKIHVDERLCLSIFNL